MKPDSKSYNPDPAYLRELIDRVDDAALSVLWNGAQRPSQRKIAARLGIPERTFRQYLTSKASHQDAPYTVQFALEELAGYRRKEIT